MERLKTKLQMYKVSDFNEENEGLTKRYYFTLGDYNIAAKIYQEIYSECNIKSR